MKRFLLALLSLAFMMSAAAVTLNVTVPAGTKACFVAGDFNGWDAKDAVQLQKSGDNKFTITLADVSTSAMEKGYKYLSGPDWAYVEKGASGEEIGNRTSVSSNDVVAKWASLYNYNANLTNTKITVNGYSRKVEILLPEGYDSSSERYPVLYYVGVQQRYSNAGSDDDAGDFFFNANSWNADALQETAAFKSSPCIMVATHSFVAENIPYANPMFVGSGQSDVYLNEFISKVMGYVNSNYRTLTDAASTTIMGADLGGMLAMYATLTHPNQFGRCLAMSPLLWINHDEMSALAASFTGSNKILVTYGSAEPPVISDNLVRTASTETAVITNGTHDDDSWGKALPALYPYIAGGNAPATIAQTPHANVVRRAPDISSTTYQLYSNIDNTTLVIDNTASFSYITNFRKGSADVAAQALVRDIPTSVKTKFYWNVARMPENTFLLSSPGNVSFSSKKSSESWLRVVILDGETVENVAAASTGFTLQNAGNKVSMSVSGSHKVKTTASFASSDKKFTIHYGSVNSGSDMGAITTEYSVSASCTQATVEYDFLTNRVEITETSWGDVIDNVKIACFSAVPSVTTPGQSSHITITLDEPLPYTATLSAALNYGTPSNVTLTPNGTNSWTADLSNLKSGIYSLSLNLKRGTASKDNAATIWIKVVGTAGEVPNTRLVANAYADVDWATTGRYKANFHTHTSQSFDTKFRTDEVVDKYKAAGYKILALTDHDANPYPWDYFDLYNPAASPRNAESLGMLAIPGVELSKDNRNNWSEATGGEFNHHNDFFTGRKGQEFASLRESYAYTYALGGMQIINHPGQYWSLDTEYAAGAKNSPDWHAENFLLYPSLVGLEVYNQGNRRPNDRILWDQILTKTMPERPVWGYSCDDTHTAEQYFRNYEYMLMPSLDIDALKTAMRTGALYFSYEYTGSGNALAPKINSISVNEAEHTITVDTDGDRVVWICGTDRSGGASTRKSTIVGIGNTFCYKNFAGNYVRALITNSKGETCTQPFGFSDKQESGLEQTIVAKPQLFVTPNPADTRANVAATATLTSLKLYNAGGQLCLSMKCDANSTDIDVSTLPAGIYVVIATLADNSTLSAKLIVK